MTVLARHGVTVRNVAFDPMIAAHVGGRKSLGIEALALQCLDFELKPVSDIIGRGRRQIPLSEVTIPNVADHAGARVDAAMQLRDYLSAENDAKWIARVLAELDMPPRTGADPGCSETE